MVRRCRECGNEQEDDGTKYEYIHREIAKHRLVIINSEPEKYRYAFLTLNPVEHAIPTIFFVGMVLIAVGWIYLSFFYFHPR